MYVRLAQDNRAFSTSVDAFNRTLIERVRRARVREADSSVRGSPEQDGDAVLGVPNRPAGPKPTRNVCFTIGRLAEYSIAQKTQNRYDRAQCSDSCASIRNECNIATR
jgi:hypothetical protein